MNDLYSDDYFTANCLIACKENFEDFEGMIRSLNRLKPDIDNAYKRAFWQGAYDYACFVCGKPCEVKTELKLDRLTWSPSAERKCNKKQLEDIWAHCMPTWLEYNIVTGGCNTVC